MDGGNEEGIMNGMFPPGMFHNVFYWLRGKRRRERRERERDTAAELAVLLPPQC